MIRDSNIVTKSHHVIQKNRETQKKQEKSVAFILIFNEHLTGAVDFHSVRFVSKHRDSILYLFILKAN